MEATEREHKEAEEAKWAGVPAWKRALMEEKERKTAEARAPVERQAGAKEKKMAELESMPQWKRNLLLQKPQ